MRGLILSAGLGERLRPLTLKRAKPAIEFLNMPMLAFPYYWLDTLGLTEVVLNTHYLPDTIRHAAMHVVSPETQLHFTHEDAILGSGGGIWNARFHLQEEEHFAVANGDAVVAIDDPHLIRKMFDSHVRSGALATLLTCPHEGVGRELGGVFVRDDHRVVNFGKAGREPGLTGLHYASFVLFSSRVWKYMPAGPSNILYDVLEAGIANGERVMAFEASGLRWFETGNSADYLRATRTCLEALRDRSLSGLNLLAMLNRFVPLHEEFSDLRTMRLHSQPCGAEIAGFSVVGEDAEVTDGVRLEDAVVLPGARVERAVVRDVVI